MRKENNRLSQSGNQIIYKGRMSGMQITRREQKLFLEIREQVLNDTYLSEGYRSKAPNPLYDFEQYDEK